MSGRLAGKRALVTGASRGIGRAIAIAYAVEGADVALLARDEAKLAEVAAEIEGLGRRAVVLACDVTDAEAIGAAVSTAIGELGGIDVVVNNAGGNSFSRPLAEVDNTLSSLRLILILVAGLGVALASRRRWPKALAVAPSATKTVEKPSTKRIAESSTSRRAAERVSISRSSIETPAR